MSNTHRHLKTGHEVEVVAIGKAQCSLSPINEMDAVVIYRHGGEWWVRSHWEFNDGRFEELPEATEIVHTEPIEFDEFIKRQLAAHATLLENSWRASLRKERDARLNEVRLKEKAKSEIVALTKRIEELQKNV